MPFSHHSHSGQFCGHAENTLEAMIQTAITKKMSLYCLTEHMPRQLPDLYPEEVSTGITPSFLETQFSSYHHEATRLLTKYTPQISLLLGLEIDWIRPSSLTHIQSLLTTYHPDILIGSVHHVHAIPIDYSRALYLAAREQSGGSEERLFCDYFDLQYEMLERLRPPVVGHFDLVRLWSDEPKAGVGRWEGVWGRVVRNLGVVRGYGGVLEVNSAGLRKGLGEPYPGRGVCEKFLEMGGGFVLSDDAHGVDQVGTCYKRAVEWAGEVGIGEFTVFGKGGEGRDERFPGVGRRKVGIAEVKAHAFFSGPCI